MIYEMLGHHDKPESRFPDFDQDKDIITFESLKITITQKNLMYYRGDTIEEFNRKFECSEYNFLKLFLVLAYYRLNIDYFNDGQRLNLNNIDSTIFDYVFVYGQDLQVVYH